MKENRRFILKGLIDIFLINFALLFALLLRFDGHIPEQYIAAYLKLVPVFTLAHLACNYRFGLHKRLWQYSGIYEMMSIIYAVSLGVAIDVMLAYFMQQTLPRSTYILLWILGVVLMGALRIQLRIIRSRCLFNRSNCEGIPVLIIGAGDAGVMVTKELLQNNDSKLRIIGFIDDDPFKQNSKLLGLPIFGKREDIPQIVKENQIEEIIIAIPSAPGSVIREISQICRKQNVRVRTVPALHELFEGRVTVNQIREVKVEDLLRRDSVKLDLSDIAKYLDGQCVLVTGAGGSIGSELCRQIVQFNPEALLLLGHDENPIFGIHNELKHQHPEICYIPVIADIKDKNKLKEVFETYKPAVVFHAAAHKHVPLMEEHPMEAVKNNIFGTLNLAETANKVGTGIFVLISTDKAVNPSCIMGTTKLVTEMIMKYFSHLSKTRFVAVRFGNVLGSRGSVIETFKEQIQNGGPVTVTHEEMTRYFMTIPEAAQLVIQAGAIAKGGELFVLDMGEPVKILDLAKDMIRCSGFYEEDIEIEIVGIRPGEKLHEELVAPGEVVLSTRHPRIMAVKPGKIETYQFEEWLGELAYYAYKAYNPEKVIALLDAVAVLNKKSEAEIAS